MVTSKPFWLVIAGFLLAVPAWSQTLPITIVKVRDLSFGKCDEVPGKTYTVRKRENPGRKACPGARSARFEVSGDPNGRITITSFLTVKIDNGTQAIVVNLNRKPARDKKKLDASGHLTIYMGGNLTIPTGGVNPPYIFTGTSSISVVYR